MSADTLGEGCFCGHVVGAYNYLPTLPLRRLSVCCYNYSHCLLHIDVFILYLGHIPFPINMSVDIPAPSLDESVCRNTALELFLSSLLLNTGRNWIHHLISCLT